MKGDAQERLALGLIVSLGWRFWSGSGACATLVASLVFGSHSWEQTRLRGSNAMFGHRFRTFGINDLEMVDQTGIEPVTS